MLHNSPSVQSPTASAKSVCLHLLSTAISPTHLLDSAILAAHLMNSAILPTHLLNSVIYLAHLCTLLFSPSQLWISFPSKISSRLLSASLANPDLHTMHNQLYSQHCLAL